MMKRPILFSALSLHFLLAVFVTMTMASPKALESDATLWETNDSMVLFFQAISDIKRNYLKPLSDREIVNETLKSYLRYLDPYSDYLSSEEYAAYKASQQSNYSGVGMELDVKPSGKIVCMPYPNSPAERAGIEFGDSLKSVDGKDISLESVLNIGMRIRGKAGSEVTLDITKKDGSHKQVRIKRSAINATSVLVDSSQSFPIIRIFSFTNRTKEELEDALSHMGIKKDLIIDLRGNPGGDLYEAIDCATLFLGNDKKVVGIKTQDGLLEHPQTLLPGEMPFDKTPSLYLWQDGRTASAAEVFIAGLVQNGRAASIGQKTFGKGTTQKIIELMDGSALFLTNGYLQTPSGVFYDKRGLEPSYVIGETDIGQAAYLSKVQEIVAQSRIAKLPATEPDRTEEPLLIVRPPGSVQDSQSEEETSGEPPASVQNEIKNTRYVLCFDRDFTSESDSEIYSTAVQKSLKTPYEYYSLQRVKPGGNTAFITCLGRFETQDDAEEKRLRISELMGTDMFVETLWYDDDVASAKERTTGTTSRQAPVEYPMQLRSVVGSKPTAMTEQKEVAIPPSKSSVKAAVKPATIAQASDGDIYYGIRTSTCKTAQGALDEMDRLKQKSLQTWVQIEGYASRKEADDDIKRFKSQGFKAHLTLCKEKPPNCRVQYVTYIGPEKQKNDDKLKRLKQERIIGQDARWDFFKKNEGQ